MDYSGLVKAIQDGDDITANKLCSEAIPIFRKYLVKKFAADLNDADDAIQRMFEYIILKIQNDEIENPHGLLQYMLKACSHNYIKSAQEKNSPISQDLNFEPSSKPNQIWGLVNEDQQQLLKYCVEKLRKGYQEFFSFCFSHPGATTEDIADHFEISTNNAWTRKHRVINKIAECVETKIIKN